uniref:Ice-binding protein isoform1a n=1 Tax=Antarctomyces psychrotrophicus TaxID=89416 RepID=A0A2Z6DSM4_ANTPS|nr:ice-binding protein isoform1a [Antarctomyces psychrotrophicus]
MVSAFMILCVLGSAFVSNAAGLDLGAASSFGALAPQGVANAGATVINGDMGTTGTSITGFPPGLITGQLHINDNTSTQAFADSRTAFVAGQALIATVDQAGTATLGGNTFVAGVYKYDSAVGLDGVLTLDGAGDASSVWVFQLATTLVTYASSSIILTNGAKANNVFWIVGSSATLGTYSHLEGNVIANALIAAQTGATINGALLAGSAVTLDSNTVTVQNSASKLVRSAKFFKV